MNRIRNVRRAAALTVATAAVVVGVGFPSPAQAMPNNGSAMCNYLWGMVDAYTDIAGTHPQGSLLYHYYLDLAGAYLDSWVAARC